MNCIDFSGMAVSKNTHKNNKKRIVRMSAALLALASTTYNPDLIRAQTLSCPQSFLFGNYTTCASTETSTISPAGARTTSGCLSAGGAPFNAAQCNVSQTFPVTNVSISVTAASFTVKNATSKTMVVDNFSCRFQGSITTKTGTCSFTTSGFFFLMDIGARLNVGNPQESGTYSGTFTVQTNFP